MGRLCATLLLTLSFVSIGNAIKSKRTVRRFLQAPGDSDDMPLCKIGTRAGFNSSVLVYLNKDNSRSLAFDTDDVGTQTQVVCKGPAPSGCLNFKASRMVEVPSCANVECDCDRDVSDLEFVYMKKMMKEAIPMCEGQSSGFRALMIGLGGGALPEYFLGHCPEGTSVESVEYDPRVIEAATHFFGLHVQAGVNEVENNDASQAVQARARAGKKYDLIMVDCFASEGFVPPSCRNDAFVSGMHSILNSGGSVIQQVWTKQYESTLATYEHTFGKNSTEGIDAEMQVSWLIKATVPGATLLPQ